MGIITTILSSVGGFLDRRRESKDKQGEREFELIKAGYKSTEDSWKDEYITVTITAPMILIFIFCLLAWDEGLTRIQKGFEIMDTLPAWYQELLTYTVLAGLGIIGVVKPLTKHLERKANRQQPPKIS